MRPAYWVPPIVWMAVMFWLSTDAGSAEHTSWILLPLLRRLLPWATPGELDAVHLLVRKSGHLSEYALLAALWFRAFRRGRGLSPRASAWVALALSLGWAFLEEWHQATLLTRTPSAADVALDGLGALAALAAARLGWRAAVDAATGALLWLALVGGAAAIALNVWAGVPGRALWLTTPLAALVLLVRRHIRS